MVKRDGEIIGFNYSIGKVKDRIDKDCIVSKNPLVCNNSKYDILEYYEDVKAWFSITKFNKEVSRKFDVKIQNSMEVTSFYDDFKKYT